MINESSRAATYQAKGAETAEEIIGVLTAISVVSKRMARKLALLEQQTAERKEGNRPNGKRTAVSLNAD